MLPDIPNLSAAFDKGSVELRALVDIVTSSLNDAQDSKSNWEAGSQQAFPIATQINNAPGLAQGATSITVDDTNGFTAGNATNVGFLIFTDGNLFEIASYNDMDDTTFKGLSRGLFGTSDQAWANGDTVYQLTWSEGSAGAYDLQIQTRNWYINRAVGGAGPPSQRVGHGWVYRPTDECFYLFGGYDGTNYLNGLWKFDPGAGNWTEVIADGTVGNPTARAYFACVYNENDDEIWVAGGRSTVGIANVYKYSFGGGTWSTNGSWNMNHNRYAMSAAWDSDSNQLIVAGGFRFFVISPFWQKSTYVFNGSTWTQKADAPRKFARGDACWMSHEKRFFTVAVGTAFNQHIFTYDPTEDEWEEKSPPSGTHLQDPGVCYDPNSRKALVFGGEQSGTAVATLWAYSFGADNWVQLDTYSFDSSADTYGQHRFEWDSVNHFAVAWGGHNDTSTFHTYDEPIYFRHHHATSVYRTQSMDLGSIPTENGHFELEDSSDVDNTVSDVLYAAEFSDNDADWTPIAGNVIDGQEISDLHRYFRVTATLTCNCDASPSVQLIDTVFDLITRFSFSPEPVGDEQPICTNIAALTSDISILKNSVKIGKAKIQLNNIGRLANAIVKENYLTDKPVIIKIGARGLTEMDYSKIYTGRMVDWGGWDGQKLTLGLKDYLDKIQVDVPQEIADGTLVPIVYSTAGVTHPVNIIMDLLQNKVNVPDRYLNVDSFTDAAADASMAGWEFIRTLDTPEDAQKLIMELLRHVGGVIIPREDGKLEMKLISNATTPVAIWDMQTQNIKGAKFDADMDSLRNFISTWWEWDGDGDEWNDFSGAEVSVDATSVTNWDTEIFRTKSKWLGAAGAPYNGDTLASAISSRILSLAKEPLHVVSLSTNLSTWRVQVGDIVRVQADVLRSPWMYDEWQRKYNPGRDLVFAEKTGRQTLPYITHGADECVDMKFWVTSKKPDFKGGRIKWKLTRARQMPLEDDFNSQAEFQEGISDQVDLLATAGKVVLAFEVTDLLDNCETADWTESAQATNEVVNNADFIEGNASLDLGKSGSATSVASYSKTLGSTFDGANKHLDVYQFHKDITDLKLSGAVVLHIGSDSGNYFRLILDRADLNNNWDNYDGHISELPTTGSPDIANLDYLEIRLNTINNAKLITSGDIKMDWWRLMRYFETGTWQTVIDLGQQPEAVGAVTLVKTEGYDSVLVVEMWASETGKFSGEEMYLGTVAHNDAITLKTRYYKVLATLTASTDRDTSPTLDQFKLSFRT